MYPQFCRTKNKLFEGRTTISFNTSFSNTRTAMAVREFTIPPLTDQFIHVQLPRSFRGKETLITKWPTTTLQGESDQAGETRDNLEIIEGLTTVNSRNLAVCRVSNVSDQPLTIKAGTAIARATPLLQDYTISELDLDTIYNLIDNPTDYPNDYFKPSVDISNVALHGSITHSDDCNIDVNINIRKPDLLTRQTERAAALAFTRKFFAQMINDRQTGRAAGTYAVQAVLGGAGGRDACTQTETDTTTGWSEKAEPPIPK